MDQAELGLPSREYYIVETDSEYKAAYLRYMINVAQLFDANETVAVHDMHDVLHFEELLANVSCTLLRYCPSLPRPVEIYCFVGIFVFDCDRRP